MVQISYWKHPVLRALLWLQAMGGEGRVMKSEDFVEEVRVCRRRMDFITAPPCVPGLDVMGSCGVPAALWLAGLSLATHTGRWFYFFFFLGGARKMHEISRTTGSWW